MGKYRVENFFLRPILLFILLISVLMPSVNAEEGNRGNRKILVISTFHLSHPWTKAICDKISKTFVESSSPYLVDYLELNAIRNRESDFKSKFVASLPKLEKGEYDLLVAILDDAINLTLEYYKTLPADLPIIFCGYTDIPENFKADHPNITGIGGPYDIKAAVNFILQLYPATSEIMIVSDDFPSGKLLHEQILREFRNFKDCKITSVNGAQYNTRQMLDKVRTLPPDGQVLFTPWRSFARDGYPSLEKVADDLAQIAPHPFFVLNDVLFNHGALGGLANRSSDVGDAAIDLMQQIINGREVKTLPFEPMPTRFMVDIELFQREKLDSSRLPFNTVIVNGHGRFYQEYPTETVIIGISILLLLVLLFIIAVNHVRYRRASRKHVRELEALLSNKQIYNDCLQKITLSENFADAVNDMLMVIGKNCNAIRCYISCCRPPADFTDDSFEWTSPGIPHILKTWNVFKQDAAKELIAELRKNKARLINIDKDYPELFQTLAQHYHRENIPIRSALLCSIEDKDGFWGVIGLSRETEERFSREEEDMLKNSGKLFCLAREHAQQQLKLDQSVYIRKVVFNHIRIPIFLFDRNSKLINVNPAACDVIQASAEEILSRPCFQSYCGYSCPPDDCPVKRSLATGKPQSAEYTFGQRELLITSEPIFDSAGQVIYVLESAIDMTEINRSRRDMAEAVKAAQAADRAKSNFIATMNHELRTPLNAVIGFSELLQLGGIDDADEKEYLQAINTSGKALLGLVNDILDISKLDAGQLQFTPVPTDPVVLIEELLTMFRGTAKEKNLQMESVCTAIPPQLLLDAPRLKQIILNLLGNAVKFTPRGSVRIEAEFRKETDNSGQLTIAVIDTGIGINEDFIAKIFDPFSQEEAVRGSRAYQGSGLGLTITRKLAQAMRGRISVESRKNVGSTFTLTLEKVEIAPVKPESPIPPESA